MIIKPITGGNAPLARSGGRVVAPISQPKAQSYQPSQFVPQKQAEPKKVSTFDSWRAGSENLVKRAGNALDALWNATKYNAEEIKKNPSAFVTGLTNVNPGYRKTLEENYPKEYPKMPYESPAYKAGAPIGEFTGQMIEQTMTAGPAWSMLEQAGKDILATSSKWGKVKDLTGELTNKLLRRGKTAEQATTKETETVAKEAIAKKVTKKEAEKVRVAGGSEDATMTKAEAEKANLSYYDSKGEYHPAKGEAGKAKPKVVKPLSSKVPEEIEVTPDKARGIVTEGNLSDTKLGKELMKIATQAEKEGETIRITPVSKDMKLPKGTVVEKTPGGIKVAVERVKASAPAGVEGKSTPILKETPSPAEAGAKTVKTPKATALKREVITLNNKDYPGMRSGLTAIRPNGTASFDLRFAPAAQRKGMGTKAYQELERIAREKGARQGEIDAFKESQGFWEKMGYKATGKKDIAGNIIMVKDFRGLKPEVKAPVTTLPKVEPQGTGKKVTPQLSLGVEEKAIKNKLVKRLPNLPERQQFEIDKQVKEAVELTKTDSERAIRIALGKENSPGNLLPEAVFEAVENKAIREGDVTLIRELANSPLTKEASTMGARIRMLAERDPDSPVSLIRQVQEAKAEGVKQRVGVETDKAVKKTVDAIKKEIKVPDKADWFKFVESIKC